MSRAFNGTNQYLRKAATIPNSGGTPMTFACWAKTNASALQVLIGHTADGLATSNYLRLDASRNVTAVSIDDDSSSGTATTSAAASTGTWFHACAVFTTVASRTAYLNGANAVTDTANTPNMSSTDRLNLGRDESSIHYLNGNLAEAAEWSAALTATEVAALAAGINPLSIRPTSLIAYWPLFGHYSPETDMMVGQYTLTVTGATQDVHPAIRHKAYGTAAYYRSNHGLGRFFLAF